MDIGAAQLLYPSVPTRIKAGEIDVLVMTAVSLAVVAAYLFIGYETPLILLFIVALIVLYEPVFVSFRGATVGHRLMGITIIDAATKQPLSLPRAFLRSGLKIVLGIASIIAAYLDKREQFLHDRIIGSRAILANVSVDSLDSAEQRVIAAKAEAAARFAMPSLARRIVFTVMYGVGSLIALSFAMFTMFPECVDQRCRGVDDAFGGILSVILIVVIVAGMRGNLPGARRRLVAAL